MKGAYLLVRKRKTKDEDGKPYEIHSEKWHAGCLSCLAYIILEEGGDIIWLTSCLPANLSTEMAKCSGVHVGS